MEFLADILLGFGALAAAVYCFVLSRKLSKLRGLDQDLGGAIAILSQQVDEMSKALTSAKETAATSANDLASKSKTASEIAERLEMMIAALHDLPDPEEQADAEFIEEAAAPTKDVTVFVRNASRRAAG